MRLSRLFSAALAGLALLSAGCLDFEKQTFVVTFNPDKDEINILLLYEGMRVGGDDDKDVKRAKETLEMFFLHGKGFYLGHPMLGLNLVPEKEDPTRKPDPRKLKQQKLFLDHVSIGDRALFVAKDGTLSGTQELRISAASKFVAGLNEMISEEILENADKKLTDATKRGNDEVETLKLQQKAARDKHQWVRVEPGRINLQLVGTRKYFERMKRELYDDAVMADLRNALLPPPPPRPGQAPPPARTPAETLDGLRKKMKEYERGAAFLTEVPLSVEQRKDRLTISVGLGDGEVIRAFSPYYPASPGRSEPILEHGKTLKVPMLKDATAESVIADFLRKYSPKK